jgi:hypothetical protein
LGGTGKAEAAKLPDAGISPKQWPKKMCGRKRNAYRSQQNSVRESKSTSADTAMFELYGAGKWSDARGVKFHSPMACGGFPFWRRFGRGKLGGETDDVQRQGQQETDRTAATRGQNANG